MNVFIDTNLLLDFYRMGKDKLDELEKVFALHNYGKLKLWLPELLKNEFWRNRSNVVAKAIKDIEKDYNPSPPHMFRQHPDFKDLNKAVTELNKKKNKIFSNIQTKFKEETLAADLVIKKMFDEAHKIKVDEEIIQKGKRRYDLGNPPGKNDSYGDAVNQECLLKVIPEGEDLYLITEDSDYKSPFIDGDLNEYLKHEWKTKKKSEPHIYSRVSEFISEHFPQAKNIAELEANLIIDQFENSSSFYSTHRIIEKLKKIQNLSQRQILKLMRIYINNPQVEYIKNDSDVSDYGNELIDKYERGKNQEDDEFVDSFEKLINAKENQQ